MSGEGQRCDAHYSYTSFLHDLSVLQHNLSVHAHLHVHTLGCDAVKGGGGGGGKI